MNPPPRRFTMLDGMVLIGATAVAVGWVRDLPRALRSIPWSWSLASIWQWAQIMTLLAFPFVLLWSAAIVGLRLRAPRPSLRRLARQPGLVATAATVGGFVVVEAVWLPTILWVLKSRGNPGSPWRYLWGAGSLELYGLAVPSISLGVMMAWLTLALSRRWRCEPSWIDRAGRVLGLYWVASGPVLAVAFLTQLML